MNLDSITISPARIHLLGISIAVVLLGSSAYAVYSSWETRQLGIESHKQDLSQVDESLSASQRQRGRLVDQIAKLESVVKDINLSERPSTLNELAVKVVALAEQYELQLDQFEPAAPTGVGNDQVYPIDLRVIAPYESVTSWLDDIYRTMPDIHVVAISISSQDATSTAVSSDIRLNWYIPTDDKPTQ